MSCKYTWIVTRDALLGDSSDAIGKLGPSGVAGRARFDIVILNGEHFRLLDEAGEVRYIGYILGEYGGPEPLEDYGRKHGCVAVEYERDGKWVTI
jgi:hypothetical protein